MELPDLAWLIIKGPFLCFIGVFLVGKERKVELTEPEF